MSTDGLTQAVSQAFNEVTSQIGTELSVVSAYVMTMMGHKLTQKTDKWRQF